MPPGRARREPPPFRPVAVVRVEEMSPRLVRVTLQGPELGSLAVPEPAASVRVLLPPPGADRVVLPEWTGNEFRLPDGSRPVIRTLTPLRFDPGAGELDVAVVVHGAGVASRWARSAAPGGPAAVSGPGRGYAIPADATGLVLAGDETALPAISQLLEVLPSGTPVEAHVELAAPDARLDLPDRPATTVAWHERAPGEPPGTALVEAVRQVTDDCDAHFWVAGEAAAVQRIRRLLFEDRGLPRARGTVRGYWKHGRSGDVGSDQ